MKSWPHAPPHWYSKTGIYMVTAGTFNKEHFFKSPKKLDILQDSILNLTEKFSWQLQAWAIFSNHYHFIARSSQNPETLKTLISMLHTQTARSINEIDQQIERRVWYNSWETNLSYQTSYLARLKYVHNNPVKHGLVSNATSYDWCSAHWFETIASSSFKKVVDSFDISKINVFDDF